jgi:hypothetical protein
MKLTKKQIINPETGKENHYEEKKYRKHHNQNIQHMLDETRFTDGNEKYGQHVKLVHKDIADIFQMKRSDNVLHTTSQNVLHTLNQPLVLIDD